MYLITCIPEEKTETEFATSCIFDKGWSQPAKIRDRNENIALSYNGRLVPHYSLPEPASDF